MRMCGLDPFSAMLQLAEITTAYRQNNAPAFNTAVDNYRGWLEKLNFQKELQKGRAEFYFNDAKTFLHATIIYICALVLAAVAILTISVVPNLSEALRRSAFYLVLIAHNLALGGDTMQMLRAVLDTNFWLATHVVVITLGYASTFFAGLLAILYIFLGVFTPLLTQKLRPKRGIGSERSIFTP